MSKHCRKCGRETTQGSILQPSEFGGLQDYEYRCDCGFSEIYAFLNHQSQVVTIAPHARIHWSGRPAMTH